MTFKEYADEPWGYDGLSAKCIYRFSLNEPTGIDYPHDPDDWCRCLQVLRKVYGEYVPNRIQALRRLADSNKTKQWRAIADNYDELMKIFASEWDPDHAPKTYAFMKKIYGEEN